LNPRPLLPQSISRILETFIHHNLQAFSITAIAVWSFVLNRGVRFKSRRSLRFKRFKRFNQSRKFYTIDHQSPTSATTIPAPAAPRPSSHGGYIMPTATSEQLGGLLKEANDRLLALYKSRDVSYKKDKTGAVKMTVYKNRKKEYETYISDSSSPSLVNPQILIIRHYDPRSDGCTMALNRSPRFKANAPL